MGIHLYSRELGSLALTCCHLMNQISTTNVKSPNILENVPQTATLNVQSRALPQARPQAPRAFVKMTPIHLYSRELRSLVRTYYHLMNQISTTNVKRPNILENVPQTATLCVHQPRAQQRAQQQFHPSARTNPKPSRLTFTELSEQRTASGSPQKDSE